MSSRQKVFVHVAAGLLLAALRLEAQPSCGPTFLQTSSYPTQENSDEAIATGDFTEDGFIDIVTVGVSISVLPGDGAGGFGAPITSPFSNHTNHLVVADLDDDGHLDIASGDFSISVYLGDGDGGFAFAGSYAGNSNVRGFSAGDVDGDGTLDLILASSDFNDYGVAILLGYGDGTFEAPVLYVHGVPQSLAVADFNEDGRSDVATPLENDTVAIYLSLPDGTLPNPTFVTVGSDMRGSVAGDVDGDGNADLVISRTDELELLYGNGNGTFDAPVPIPTVGPLTPLVVLDADDDGLNDIVGSKASETTSLAIVFQSAPGTFRGPALYLPSHSDIAIAAGFFDGDARPDYAALRPFDDLVDVFLWQGNLLAASPLVPGPLDPGRLAVGDFDGDGIDEVAARYDFETLGVSGLDVDGRFRILGTSPLTVNFSIQAMASAEFTSDAYDDLAVALDGGYRVLLSTGDHTFTAAPPGPSVSFPVGLLVTGDFDGDGLADLVLFPENAGEGGSAFLRGHGDGTFEPPVVGPGPEHPVGGLIAVDLDGDGPLDLVTANSGACCGQASDAVSVFRGNGDGTFQPPNDYAAGPGPAALAAADFDGDGHLDIVTANSLSTNVSLLRGDGTGALEPPVLIGIAWSPSAIVAADFNDDGFADIATADGGGSNGARNLVSILLGDGHGAFAAPGLCMTSARPVDIVAGQFDGTGPVDAAVSNSSNYGGPGVGFLLATGLAVSEVAGPASAAPGGSVALQVTATGAGPLQYQWRRNGVPLSNGSSISGAGTPKLTITPVGFADAGQYDVEVTDGCGSVVSAAASLAVEFLDVSPDSPFYEDIVAIAESGITSGCGGGNYCPAGGVRRDQMAVFLLKARHGASYAPPPCAGHFADVPCPSGFADWIEQLAAEGVTSGCGSGLFCPAQIVTRAQMALFLLKTKEGASYTPPPAAGLFADVPVDSFAAAFIEDLSTRGITGGCGVSPLRYCPGSAVLRQQMAAFLVRTFQP